MSLIISWTIPAMPIVYYWRASCSKPSVRLSEMHDCRTWWWLHSLCRTLCWNWQATRPTMSKVKWLWVELEETVLMSASVMIRRSVRHLIKKIAVRRFCSFTVLHRFWSEVVSVTPRRTGSQWAAHRSPVESPPFESRETLRAPRVPADARRRRLRISKLVVVDSPTSRRRRRQ